VQALFAAVGPVALVAQPAAKTTSVSAMTTLIERVEA